jgi:hypothetical protein
MDPYVIGLAVIVVLVIVIVMCVHHDPSPDKFASAHEAMRDEGREPRTPSLAEVFRHIDAEQHGKYNRWGVWGGRNYGVPCRSVWGCANAGAPEWWGRLMLEGGFPGWEVRPWSFWGEFYPPLANYITDRQPEFYGFVQGKNISLRDFAPFMCAMPGQDREACREYLRACAW